MRTELIGYFEPCMTEIYLHIDARMADYIRTHPYSPDMTVLRGLVSSLAVPFPLCHVP